MGGTAVSQTGAAANAADRLGLTAGMVVQELGWDNDTDDDLRIAVEDAIDADMVDGDYGNVVDAVVLWWRDEDGDLVDGLVEALTDLVGGGSIWLLTPKVGRPNAVDPADIADIAKYVVFIQAKFHDIDEHLEDQQIPWEPVLRALKDAGYTGYLSSEYEGERIPWRSIEQVRRQHSLMRSIASRLP